MKSFALCSLPTANEPGSQCHGEAGKDLTAILPSGNPTLKRKLVGYAGGMTIEVDPDSQKGITVWRTLKGEYVGEKHYKRELAIAGSQLNPKPPVPDGSVPEKRNTSALPVFHGNPKTSNFLHLKPNFLNDAGSNSLKFGSERR